MTTHEPSDLLTDPAVCIGFSPRPTHPVDALQAAMARFSDGDDHGRRRAQALDALAEIDVDEVAEAASTQAAAWLEARCPGTVDVMELARTLPVRVLAEALGYDDLDRVTTGIAALCGVLGPRTEPLADDEVLRHGFTAVDLLEPFLDTDAHPLNDPDEVGINRLALLFQTRDATAAAIGLRLAAELGFDRPTLAVTSTSRVVDGERIVVELDDATAFGAGPHACPGRALAEEITTAVVDTVRDWTSFVVEIGPLERRPNLAMTSHFVVRLTEPVVIDMAAILAGGGGPISE